jgi:predicted nucleic acid-binding protein
MEITVDTSAIMAVLLNEPSKERLREQTRGVELVSAPTLPWEVGNGLSALFKRKRLDRNQAAIALMSFRQIPVRLGEVEIEAAVRLAEEQDICAYDACVLECARKYRTPLLSLDGSQMRIARGLGIEVLEV